MIQVHIKKGQFEQLHKGILIEKEKKLLLDHCRNCDICAEILADSMTRLPMIKAPRGMKSRILEKTKREKKLSQQLQLFVYGLRVSTVAIGTCALLWTVNFGTISQITNPINNTNAYKIEKVNEEFYKYKTQLNESIYKIKSQFYGG